MRKHVKIFRYDIEHEVKMERERRWCQIQIVALILEVQFLTASTGQDFKPLCSVCGFDKRYHLHNYSTNVPK